MLEKQTSLLSFRVYSSVVGLLHYSCTLEDLTMEIVAAVKIVPEKDDSAVEQEEHECLSCWKCQDWGGKDSGQ